MGRLREGWDGWRHPYVLPLHQAERLAQDASTGRVVRDLPDYAEERLAAEWPPNPQVVTIVRQFRDVRDAVAGIAAHDTELLPEGRLAPAVASVVESSSHRIDPWITALGTRRLRRLTARGIPRRIGAYGWVDDLSPAADPTPPTSAGLLHAPGNTQALAAAVLRDHAVHGDDQRWQITARSDLVRLAARLGGDVRLGVHISEALGREIERRAGDPASVLKLRQRFPARPEWVGRRVCDGQKVLDADPASVPAEVGPLDDLRQVIDTYGDLLVADAVHDVVSGRGAAAQEAMEAAAGLGVPPELRLLRTQRQGASVRTTVLVALPVGPSDPASPVTIADPSLARVLEDEVGPAASWTWTRETEVVTLAELGLGVADVVLVPQSRLDALAAAALAGPATGGTAGSQRASLDQLCSLLDAQRGWPDLLGGTAAARTELLARLTALRAAAAGVLAALAAVPVDTGPALRWGLPFEGAAAALAARVAAAGDAATDAGLDVVGLGERIRALVAPVSGLPLVCTADLPRMVPAPGLDEDWLELVAAVRPAVARLEAHQLLRPWPAAASDPTRLWSVPAPGELHVVVYGPLAHQEGPAGLALLDDWAETVPSSRHTTHAAFGYDAPSARAPQAVLLAVPPRSSPRRSVSIGLPAPLARRAFSSQ